MILAAGLGRRLAPWTDEHPKPLLPFFDVTLLERCARSLVMAGVSNIVVNTFHLAGQVEAEVERLAELLPQARFLVSRESELMGTGGAIALARRKFESGRVLVMNADLLVDAPLSALLAHHELKGHSATALLLSSHAASSCRTTLLSEDGRIACIEREQLRPAPWLVFSGIYVLEESCWSTLPLETCSVISAGFRKWMELGMAVGGFDADFPWFDLGTWPRVADAAVAALRETSSKQVGFLGRQIELAPGVSVDAASDRFLPPVYVGPGCEVHGVAGPECVMWAGSEIGLGARARRTLVMPGAVVSRTVENMVVGRGWEIDLRSC